MEFDFFSVLSLIGGIALFLYGMRVMGDAIGRQAVGRFKTVLENLTSSPVKGLVLGTGITAIVQSSSATSVMVLGFVNSGIMTLENSIGLIMGANIGTTATAWILSLNSINGESFILRMLNPDSQNQLRRGVYQQHAEQQGGSQSTPSCEKTNGAKRCIRPDLPHLPAALFAKRFKPSPAAGRKAHAHRSGAHSLRVKEHDSLFLRGAQQLFQIDPLDCNRQAHALPPLTLPSS